MPLADGLTVYVNEPLEVQFDAEEEEDDAESVSAALLGLLAANHSNSSNTSTPPEELAFYPPYNASEWGKPSPTPSDVVLISAMFGDSAYKPHVRFFLKSVRDCGADILLVGDQAPPFPLPRNVRHVRLTWRGMWERVQRQVPECSIDAAERETVPGYKVIDLKPLYGVILAEEIREYTYWGHIDNDMILGDVRKFLPSDMASRDVISGLYHKNTWGPFTIFRNADKVNSVFRRGPKLCEMLADREHWGFDEKFGRDGTNMHEIVEGITSGADASGLQLSVHKGLPVGWDGKDNNGYHECELHCPPPDYPGPCRVVRRCRYFSKKKVKRCWVLGYGNKGPEMEVLLCHFQYSKGGVNEALAALSPEQTRMLELQPYLHQDKARGFYAPSPIPLKSSEDADVGVSIIAADTSKGKEPEKKPAPRTKITILTD